MLYSESRKNSTQSHPTLTIILGFILTGLLCSCSNFAAPTEKELADMQRQQLVADSAQSAQQILTQIIASSHDSLQADRMVDSYYKDGGSWIWVNQDTTFLTKASSVADFIEGQVKEIGFAPAAFFTQVIRDDVKHFQQLDFDSTQTSVSETMARLELNLSKAFLRYALGQRYGFMNPHKVLNRLDKNKDNAYRIIYDIDLEKPDSNFVEQTLSHAADEQPTQYLRQAESTHPVYALLKQELAKDSTEEGRKRILCNMERLRWRHVQNTAENEKQVFVNIPSQQLWAISPDSVFSMRICCGAWRTKTPLLTSQIRLIQFNPEWNIPSSILRDEVSEHAGDSAYFARNSYFIVQRSTGDTIKAKDITQAQLKSGAYRVAQHSGRVNSLGRIIFRFNNQFDVYLHDTNNLSAFKNERRTISHGCVRVQKPFDLMTFVLGNVDEWTLDKVRLSIDMQPETDKGKRYLKEHKDDEKIRLIHSKDVTPTVPLSVDYYTYYPNPETKEFEVWPDRYEYDIQVHKAIKPFLQ